MSNSQNIQLSFFQGITDLLFDLSPFIFLGLLILFISLKLLISNYKKIEKTVIYVVATLLFCYFFILLSNIVGIPTITELSHMHMFDTKIFNPNISLIPFSDGFSLSFILNSLLFVPFGLLAPLISPKFRSLKKILVLVFLISLIIEVSQLFTLYRVTDIDDIITNIFGGILGFMFYSLIEKTSLVKKNAPDLHSQDRFLNILPIFIFILAFINVFLT